MIPLATAALKLGLSLSVTKNLILTHKIVGSQIGGRWVAELDSVTAYLNSREAQTNAS